MKAIIFSAIFMTLIADCASDLKRHDKNPYWSGGRAVDLSLTMVEDWETGESLSVADYMVDRKLNFLLLMFGSVGCTKCNEKALELSENYLGKHQLLLSGSEKKFELLGVNTDSGGARSRFNRIMLSSEQRQASGYNFIKWVDPAGDLLMKKILAENESFGVPYTAFIYKSGSDESVLWSFNNTEPYTIDFLLEKALSTIEKREPGKGGDSKPKPKPPVPPKVEYDLSFESPNRFDDVNLIGCRSGEHSFLTDWVKGSDITFIQVAKSRCSSGSHCFDNLKRLNALSKVCANAESCGAVTLATRDVAQSTCTIDNVFRGGKDFYEVFETHFNWKYDPYIDEFGEPFSIKKVEGPLVFGFRRNGQLVYSHEGLLPRDGQTNSLEGVLRSGARERAPIINYSVFGGLTHGSAPQNLSMSTALNQAKYTVVAGFAPTCSGCIDELEHWSLDGELADFCEQSEGFCQVFALDENLARPTNTSGRLRRFNQTQNNYFKPRNIKVPLLLEAEIFSDNFGRFYQSYLSLYFKWGSYGTVIYDREGKVIFDFLGGKVYKPDPILKILKELKDKS